MTRSQFLVAVLCAVSTVAVLAPAASATFPGRPGKLVFSSLADGDKNIFAADPTAGSAWQRLTTNPSEDAQPSWSPDGTKIAFRARRQGEHYFEIYLVDADGSDEHRLTFTPRPANDALPYSSQPSWSPDGTEIVFRSNRDGEPDVWVMKADGTDPRQVEDGPGDERYPGFSPDGTRIAFTSTRDGDTDVYTIARDGTDLQQLTHNDDLYDSAPAWSPDGTRLAFERGAAGDDPTNELWTMASTGGDEQQLTDNDTLDEGAAWSPDGTRMAFTSARDDPDGDIFVMNADGSDQHVVAASPALEESPDWQPLRTEETGIGGQPPPAPTPPPQEERPGQAAPPGAVPPPQGQPSEQYLVAPRSIRRRTLLRRGLPLRLACDPACDVRVRLIAGGRRQAERTLRVGPTPKRLRLRAAKRLRRIDPRRVVVEVTFTRAGDRPRVQQARVRVDAGGPRRRG